MNRWILQAPGSVRVVALAWEEVTALHRGMQDKSRQANRTPGVLSKTMHPAEAWGVGKRADWTPIGVVTR